MKKLLLTLIVLAGALWPVQPSVAEPMTYYSYLTHHEITELGELRWFWTPDTMWGTVRTNDFLGIMYTPHFMGRVMSSQREYRRYNANELDSIFLGGLSLGVPPYEFPRTMPRLRENALIIHNQGLQGRELMTWIKLRGRNGIDVYQYPLGMAPSESLAIRIAPPQDRIIWVDGLLELEGTLSGRLTVGASHDIYLVDDVRYEDADAHTGDFDEANEQSMIAVVSERNILIKDNLRNGMQNGIEEEPDNWNRHSIVLNGSYIALGESFEIEHMNDEWDLYKSPTSPDERGKIYLKGGIAQRRKGYVHRSNHVGTGYSKMYRYDYRLERDAPPGFRPGEYSDIHGEYERLLLFHGPYDIEATRVGTLIVQEGVTVRIHGVGALLVTDSLIVQGTAERPAVFEGANGGGALRVNQAGAFVSIEHAQFADDVELEVDGERVSVNRCSFDAPVYLAGRTEVDSSSFKATLSIVGHDAVKVSRSLFRNGLIVGGNADTSLVLNNTIVGARGAGVRNRAGGSVTLTNNIIAGNRWGVFNERREPLTLKYNCLFDNYNDNYVECSAGEGSLEVDPRFENMRREDFQLGWGSPCIDAGDPASLRDPDGSRADMGAYYFDHILGAPTDNFGLRILDFGLSAAPNPFNSTTFVRVLLSKPGNIKLMVKDLTGRTVDLISEATLSAGEKTIPLNANSWPTGVYIVRVEAGSKAHSLKVVKID